MYYYYCCYRLFLLESKVILHNTGPVKLILVSCMYEKGHTDFKHHNLQSSFTLRWTLNNASAAGSRSLTNLLCSHSVPISVQPFYSTCLSSCAATCFQFLIDSLNHSLKTTIFFLLRTEFSEAVFLRYCKIWFGLCSYDSWVCAKKTHVMTDMFVSVFVTVAKEKTVRRGRHRIGTKTNRLSRHGDRFCSNGSGSKVHIISRTQNWFSGTKTFVKVYCRSSAEDGADGVCSDKQSHKEKPKTKPTAGATSGITELRLISVFPFLPSVRNLKRATYR